MSAGRESKRCPGALIFQVPSLSSEVSPSGYGERYESGISCASKACQIDKDLMRLSAASTETPDAE